MKKIILSIGILTTSILNAQNFGWLKQFEPHNGAISLNNLTVSTNAIGEIVHSGLMNRSSLGTQFIDFDPGSSTYSLTSTPAIYSSWVSKLDINGNFIWANVIDVDNNGNNKTVAKINTLGEVIVAAGFLNTGDFDSGPGTFTMSTWLGGMANGFIEKLNNDGTFAWAKQFKQITNGQALIKDIELDNSNNIYVTGNFTGTIDFDPAPTTSLIVNGGMQESSYIVKLDNAGNFKWVKTFMGSGSNSQSIAMVLDKNKNIITTGTFNGTIDFDPSAATYTLNTIQLFPYKEPFISKLDSNGNFIWAKQFVDAIPYHNNGTPITEIDVDNSNDLYVTGAIIDSLDFDPGIGTFYLKSSHTYFNPYVVKLASTGAFVWAKMFKGDFNDNMSSSIKLDNNKDVYISLNFKSNVLDLDPSVGTVTVCAYGNTAILVNRLNTNGNYLNHYYFSSNSNSSNFINSIVFDNSNNLLVNGDFSLAYNTGSEWVDFDSGTGVVKGINYFDKAAGFLVKLNNLSTGIKENIANNNFNVYPNPSNGQITIKLADNLENCKLKIHNVLGEEVYNKTINESSTLLNLNLNHGLYIITLNSNGSVATKKLVIE